MRKFNIIITAGIIMAALLNSSCSSKESFPSKVPQIKEEAQVQEAYTMLVERKNPAVNKQSSEEKDIVVVEKSLGSLENTKVDTRSGKIVEIDLNKQEKASGIKTDNPKEYESVTNIKLNKATYGNNKVYTLGDSNYIISEPKKEEGDSKKAVSQTAKKLNALNKSNPNIPLYTYFINRATDMDWYNMNNISVFSYGDYFQKQLGFDSSIISGQFVPKDVGNYMETGYKTDFHVNHKGSYEVYKSLYEMMGKDMKLSDMLVPKKETDYDNLLFIGAEVEGVLDFKDEQMDLFRTFPYQLGEYDSFVNGKKTTIGMEKEYEQGRILRDKNFNHQFSYYGGQSGVVEFNFHQPDKPNLLILSDSQGRPSRKLLAYHFNRTVFLDDVQYRSMDLQKLIKEKQIGVIVFMGQKSMFEWYEG